MNRARWTAGCASIFMLGLYVGRISVNHDRLETWAVATYLSSILIWFVPIYREQQRDDRQFRQAMKQLKQQIDRSTF